jgi:hypothetical protein
VPPPTGCSGTAIGGYPEEDIFQLPVDARAKPPVGID